MSVLRKFKKGKRILWYKEINEQFFVGAPFISYSPGHWTKWVQIETWCKQNGFKEISKNKLTEAQLLDSIRENFYYASF